MARKAAPAQAAPVNETPEPRLDVVALKELHPMKENPRSRANVAKDAELEASVGIHGILQPLLITPRAKGGYSIVCGHRRYDAAGKCGLTHVPCMVRDITALEALEIQYVENLQRADIHPLDEAEGFRALIEKHGKTVEELAVKIGRSTGYIYQRLKLCDLPKAMKEALWNDVVPVATALIVARIADAGQRKHAADAILKNQEFEDGKPVTVPMSTTEARRFVADAYMTRLDLAPFDINDESLGCQSCAVCPKRARNSDLFADIAPKHDLCNDPECYKSKVQVAYKHVADEAETDGRRVLTETENAAVFFDDADVIRVDSPYVGLDDPSPEDRKPWGKLLKPDASMIVIGRAPSGRAVKLIDRDAAFEMAAEIGCQWARKDKAMQERAPREDENNGDEPAQTVKVDRDREKRIARENEETIRACAERIIEGAEVDDLGIVVQDMALEALCKLTVLNASPRILNAVCEHRGIDGIENVMDWTYRDGDSRCNQLSLIVEIELRKGVAFAGRKVLVDTCKALDVSEPVEA